MRFVRIGRFVINLDIKPVADEGLVLRGEDAERFLRALEPFMTTWKPPWPSRPASPDFIASREAMK